jgi:hypothetical protein
MFPHCPLFFIVPFDRDLHIFPLLAHVDFYHRF